MFIIKFYLSILSNRKMMELYRHVNRLDVFREQFGVAFLSAILGMVFVYAVGRLTGGNVVALAIAVGAAMFYGWQMIAGFDKAILAEWRHRFWVAD